MRAGTTAPLLARPDALAAHAELRLGRVVSRSALAQIVTACMALGCERSSALPDAGPAPAPSATSTATASAPPATPDSGAPMELLKLTLASGVEDREPVDVLSKAK